MYNIFFDQALLDDLCSLSTCAYLSKSTYVACFCSAGAHLSQNHASEIELTIPMVVVASTVDILRTATSLVDVISFLLTSGGDFARLWLCSPCLLESFSVLSKASDDHDEAKHLHLATAKALQAFVRNSSPQNVCSVLPDLLWLLLQYQLDNDITKSICGSIDYVMAVFPWRMGADIAKQLQGMLRQAREGLENLMDYAQEVLCRLVALIIRSIRLDDLDSRLIVECLCMLVPAPSVEHSARALVCALNDESSAIADTLRSFKRGKPAYSKGEIPEDQSKCVTNFLHQCSRLAGLNDILRDSLCHYLSVHGHNLGCLRTLYAAVNLLDDPKSSHCLPEAFGLVRDIQSRIAHPPVHNVSVLLLRLYQSLAEKFIIGMVSERGKENMFSSGSLEFLNIAFEAAITSYQANISNSEDTKISIKACAMDLLWILTPALSAEKLQQVFELVDGCGGRKNLDSYHCYTKF